MSFRRMHVELNLYEYTLFQTPTGKRCLLDELTCWRSPGQSLISNPDGQEMSFRLYALLTDCLGLTIISNPDGQEMSFRHCKDCESAIRKNQFQTPTGKRCLLDCSAYRGIWHCGGISNPDGQEMSFRRMWIDDTPAISLRFQTPTGKRCLLDQSKGFSCLLHL